MSIAFLDINDWQLTLRAADGTTRVEPAGASTAQGSLEFGLPAVRHSRSHPQQFNNKYFYSLAADPISGDLRPARNHADLIYHHLKHLDLPRDDQLVLCVGGHVTNQQLGLLLGICQEVGVTVAGFLDVALAQSLSLASPANYHVLDIELHRMTLSRMNLANGVRGLQQTLALDGIGVANIIEGWMNVIADEFVQKTRFDPLHAGQSEQQLYDQVSEWLAGPSLEDRRVSVANGEANRDIEIGKNLLTEKLRQRLRALELDDVEFLALTPRTAGIPGLARLLAERVANVVNLDAAALAANYATLAEELEPGAVRRLTSTTNALPAAAQDVDQPATERIATHLLNEHVALPLHAGCFAGVIDPDSARILSADVFVNGSAQPDRALRPGDELRLDGRTFTAIRVE